MRIVMAILVVGFVFSMACARNRIDLLGTEMVTEKGIISVGVEWIKEKGKKYDLRIRLANESETGIIVMLHDLHCYKGAARGQLKHTFFNTGERTIDFLPGQFKAFIDRNESNRTF